MGHFLTAVNNLKKSVLLKLTVMLGFDFSSSQQQRVRDFMHTLASRLMIEKKKKKYLFFKKYKKLKIK